MNVPLPERASGDPRVGQTYVALVDDDESASRALSRLLRAEGMQPVLYPSAEAFLADAKRPRFDCLVLDIQLGGMSGIELHQQLKSAGSSTPVIYITAHDGPELREQAQALGCVAYFAKTAPGRDVVQAIRGAANHKEDRHS
jgi:FixJ family two-component response regulator